MCLNKPANQASLTFFLLLALGSIGRKVSRSTELLVASAHIYTDMTSLPIHVQLGRTTVYYKPKIGRRPTDMENNTQQLQPPPGYPTVDTQQQAAGGSKRKCCCGPRRRRTKRGETSFIEGCIAALCCCWLCELCCD
ncbi:uncharacterized protein [Lolium perenne]|uniref:uncharacterized protein n=1 Tax=Lolium perenne TaxID=4522 RepID=UPI0021F57A7E|nr:uncharacterized protein LOC127308539 [Lolium perenne]